MSRQVNEIKALIEESMASVKADVTLRLWDGSVFEFQRSKKENIEVIITSPDAVRRLLLSPGIATVFGLYGNGDVVIKDVSPLELMLATDHVSIKRFFKTYSKAKLLKALLPFLFNRDKAFQQRAFFTSWLDRTRRDKDMIQFHYDVSNDFYKLFLDDNMVYTCAYFRDWNNDIHQAQFDKLDHICKKLRLKSGEKMLDIGCGWGALACHAAEHYGVTVKGVTLSQQQCDLANETIKTRGLSDVVTVELSDFRDLEETDHYDKIAMIGIFEHIGRINHDIYFEKIHEMLKRRGLVLHHAITRKATLDLSEFDRPTGYMKAITKYIFPGGELDYIGRTLSSLERKGFEVQDTEALRPHYHKTLVHWHDRLWENREQANEMVGESVVRLWLLYFALFVRGFDRGSVHLFQTLASKRVWGPSGLPPTREYMYESDPKD